MSGMLNFVQGNRNGRAGSPQNGQPSGNSQRQVIAANAKVPMKAHVARPPTVQGPHVNGESMAQPRQQNVQQRLPGGSHRDPWETDTGSIDSTANQSVVRIKDDPQTNQQQLQADHEELAPTDGEEASGDEELEGSSQYEWDDNVVEYLADHNLANAPRKEQVKFMARTQPQLFPTIDGDSYPTTTDGDPTVWDEQQEQQEQHLEDLRSPSPQRPPQPRFSSLSLHQHALPQGSASVHPHVTAAAAPYGSKIWEQGAQLRGQQRIDDVFQVPEQSGQTDPAAHPPTSQPPTYSQATVEHHVVKLPATHTRPQAITQGDQGNLPQQSSRLPPGPGRVQNPVMKSTQPGPGLKHTSTIRAKVVPIIQPPIEPAPIEEHEISTGGDYNTDLLYKMNYDQLKDESFDTNPRAHEPILPENMRDKPLPERLDFAQKLNATYQSEFFSALPTDEWEDAGDWFLDRFSDIIKRTREARQKKRAAAQDFENKIETRHQHVAKKQRFVESAMTKMKAQGEGLVPRSPRPSKSPRPGRRV